MITLTVSVMCGGCGVMGGWSCVGVVTPVIGGVADDSGDSCAPRGRLQRGPRGLVPPSRARLAAHVHPVENAVLATSGRVKGRRSDRSEGVAPAGGEPGRMHGGRGTRGGREMERGLGTLPKTPLCRKRGPTEDARPGHR